MQKLDTFNRNSRLSGRCLFIPFIYVVEVPMPTKFPVANCNCLEDQIFFPLLLLWLWTFYTENGHDVAFKKPVANFEGWNKFLLFQFSDGDYWFDAQGNGVTWLSNLSFKGFISRCGRHFISPAPFQARSWKPSARVLVFALVITRMISMWFTEGIPHAPPHTWCGHKGPACNPLPVSPPPPAPLSPPFMSQLQK